jgi:hypothetical protein
MVCFSFNGLPPDPPRVWSRVQGVCPDYSPFDTNGFDALSIINKGNVLQYKKNSSHITKNQRYSKIARGKWTNRNTTWASQSTTTTIPNTKSLKRVNYNTIYLDTGAPANLPITCPPPVVSTIPSALPTNPNRNNPTDTTIQLSNSQLGITDTYTNRCPIYVTPPGPPIPSNLGPFPKVPNKPVNPIIIPVLPVINPPPTPIPPVVIPDGGNLICTISEDICTGQILSTSETRSNCNPTSASDVPGPIINLCYNDSLPTYYPRNRYVMTNSGNKFPVGYKFRSAN